MINENTADHYVYTFHIIKVWLMIAMIIKYNCVPPI